MMNRWHNTWRVLPCLAPQALRPWLTDTGSFTARLIKHFQHIHVDILHSHFTAVYPDEAASIQIQPYQLAYARDVLLCSQTTPLIYAHSVVHPRWLKHPFSWVKHQGTRSLGTALFNNPFIQRGKIYITKLKPQHPLYGKVQATLPFCAPYLWARRSGFHYQRATLLVTEVFLPHFVKIIQNQKIIINSMMDDSTYAY